MTAEPGRHLDEIFYHPSKLTCNLTIQDRGIMDPPHYQPYPDLRLVWADVLVASRKYRVGILEHLVFQQPRLPAEPVKQKMVVDMYQSLKELHHQLQMHKLDRSPGRGLAAISRFLSKRGRISQGLSQKAEDNPALC